MTDSAQRGNGTPERRPTGHRQMPRRIVLFMTLFTAATSLASGLTYEVGVIGSAGLSFAYGSYLDDKAASLAEWGASSLGSRGSSQAELFPGWSLGVYAQIDLLDWLGVRLEPRLAFLGAAREALTDRGAVFDQYGIDFYSVLIPVLACGRFPFGPGFLTATVGPFLGIVTGNVTIMDRYASSTTRATLSPDLTDSLYLGLSGGAGYALPLGPGVAAVEIRADWALTSIAKTKLGSEMTALGTTLAVSYGIQLGRSGK